MAQRPIAEGIFTWPAAEPVLIGAKCPECGLVTFPKQVSCPRCPSDTMGEHLLPRRGKLWAWTTQGFPPPPPYAGSTGEAFVPFGVGFVELPGEVKVEARLTEANPAVLKNGMDMELVVVPFGADEDGTEIMTFAFAPAS
jgi:uncharacterized OB-fold protein